MKPGLAVIALVVALMGAIALTPKSAAAQQPAPGATFPCSPAGFPNIQLRCTITGFGFANGQLTVNLDVRNAAGQLLGTLTGVPVNLPAVSGRCQILHLELGPVDLDLLGLEITTNRIILDITAQAGPGNLLGNLLCTVARLLDNPNQNALANLVNLLNRLLG